MAEYSIDQLIINSPYEEPTSYWAYHRQTRFFTKNQGRRPAGYVTATPGARSFDDPGIFRELPLVNQIRPRVKAWRQANYPGVPGIPRRRGDDRPRLGRRIGLAVAGGRRAASFRIAGGQAFLPAAGWQAFLPGGNET